MTFVPGSVTIDGAPAQDLGADGSLGLSPIAPGGQRVVRFGVRVADGGIATGTVLENTATVAFTAQDLGTRDRVTTDPARTAIAVPDVTIAKSHSPALVSGGRSTYTIDVSNAGDAATSGPVVVRDTLDTDLTPTGPAAGPGWTCTGTRAITCTRSDALAAGAAYPPIRIPVRVAPGAPPAGVGNTATVMATPDGSETTTR